MKTTLRKVALAGNPNTGKTSLFNALTGLNHQVGNYPGVTVEKKIGTVSLKNGEKISLIDLPGSYSLNGESADEHLSIRLLTDATNPYHPDAIIVVSEVENLKRNLLLFTQIKDLGLPTLLVINMEDQLTRKGINIDIDQLQKELNTQIVLLSTRSKSGIDNLKEAIENAANWDQTPLLSTKVIDLAQARLDAEKPNVYHQWIALREAGQIEGLAQSEFHRMFHRETAKRYQFIQSVLDKTYTLDKSKATNFTAKLDKWLMHPVFGYLIFFAILFVIFQGLFAWTGIAMDFIDEQFAALAAWTSENLPEGKLTDLLTEGIISGIGGVVIFIPQIAYLFLIISLLEESGYMSRVVFLMDRIMRPFGLSGKSVVPLISGNACAIPAIMATRNIPSWKERLITILVTPFTTCSARLPVYTILIALIIPDETWNGINVQGIVMMGLYALGFLSALLAAWVLKLTLKTKESTHFAIEIPSFRKPMFKNVLFNVYEKTMAFVIGAGKIILAISIILWFLASQGPDKTFGNAEQNVAALYPEATDEEMEAHIASYQIENSYIGNLGHAIEPVIRPLGYDWKIGIAIITSFAAREVFVGTLATIYAVGDTEDEATIKERMAAEVRADGSPVFDFGTGASLLVFYAFAMQCVGTLAIVKRETNSWKWPMLQLFGMGALAYIAAYIVQLLF